MLATFQKRISKKSTLERGLISSPGDSSSRTEDMTLMELTSCCGPQSVHAFSPKCRSAKSAILNGAPSRTRRLFISSGFCSGCSAVLSRLRGGSYACRRSANPTVRIGSKRIRRHENDKTVKGAACRFIIGERREKRRAVALKDDGGGCW